MNRAAASITKPAPGAANPSPSRALRQQRKDTAAHLGLRRIVSSDVTRQPRQSERLVTRVPEEHPADAQQQHGVDSLEQDRRRSPAAGHSRPEVERILSVKQSLELAARDRAQPVGVQAGLERCPDHARGDQHGGEVRRVAAVQDLARGDQREQRSKIGRVPPGRIEEEVGSMLRLAPDPVEIANRSVREYQTGRRETPGERKRIAADRRNPPPGMDQHRQPTFVCEREQALELGVGQLEPFRARVELDPPRARLHTAPGLADAVAMRVDPAERHEAPGGSLALF